MLLPYQNCSSITQSLIADASWVLQALAQMEASSSFAQCPAATLMESMVSALQARLCCPPETHGVLLK